MVETDWECDSKNFFFAKTDVVPHDAWIWNRKYFFLHKYKNM